MALVHVWNQAPLAALLILAGLQSMPENLHRAARIDGAGPRAVLQDHAALAAADAAADLILTTINSIMAFDLFWIMTKGGPGSATTVFSWMGYAYAFQFFRFGEGAAILYVLTIVCLILALVYLKLFTRPAARPARRLRRGGAASPRRCTRRRCGEARLLELPPFRRRAPALRPGAPPSRQVGLGLAAVFIFLWSFGPFLWLVLMSLSPSADLVRTPPTVIPDSANPRELPLRPVPGGVEGGQSSVQATRVPYLDLQQPGGRRCVTAVNLVLGSLAGYAYARHGRSRFMSGSLWALMMTRMTPSLALILPFFIVFRTLELIDTRTALVIAYCSLILPLSTWMMKGYSRGCRLTSRRRRWSTAVRRSRRSGRSSCRWRGRASSPPASSASSSAGTSSSSR